MGHYNVSELTGCAFDDHNRTTEEKVENLLIKLVYNT